MTPAHRHPAVEIGRRPADAVIVAVHGRDQSPQYMIDNLVEPVLEILAAGGVDPDRIGAVLPVASEGRWYPERYDAPLEANQPALDEALAAMAVVAETVLTETVLTEVDPSRVVWVGFSQGACLVADFLATTPRHWGGVAVLTGARIGPDDRDPTIDGDVDEMAMYISFGRNDEWVSVDRVTATAAAFEAAGARVVLDVFDDAEHIIRPGEIEHVADLVRSVIDSRPA